MTISLATLLVRAKKSEIYAYGIGIARLIGLPVDTWQAGDPTRSMFHLESETLSAAEDMAVGFISSGFLDHAAQLAKDNPSDPKAKMWLKVCAEQGFGVTVPEATAATTDVVLTNNGGGFFPEIEAGDLTFKCTQTGKTYTNTTGGTLASGPGTTLTVTVVADELGAESSAGAGEIDELVTGLLEVTCTNPTSAEGADELDPDTIVRICREKTGPLSPNGPREAYTSIALDSAKTFTTAITRARNYGSETGDVTTYCAGPGGGVSEPVRALAETAIVKWSTPLCTTPHVLAAINVDVDITYSIWIYASVNKTEAEIKAEIQTKLGQLFQRHPIGGDILDPPPATTGILAHSLIESTIREAFPDHMKRVVLSSPSTDTSLLIGRVARLGTVTGTVNFLAVTP